MDQIHGLHDFSGADWVGKFAGISKKLGSNHTSPLMIMTEALKVFKS